MRPALADPAAVRLSPSALKTDPFRYFVTEGCLQSELEEQLLAWFETSAPWRLVETDFYEQFEFSLLHVDLPEALQPVRDPTALRELGVVMGDAFGVRFDDRISLVAHKLVPGQRIAIHNDFLKGEETHRLTVQLNRGLSDDDGGFFMLFNSFEASDVHKILRPVHGTALGFEIGPHSYHAVSRLRGGERYTIVFSFYADRAQPSQA